MDYWEIQDTEICELFNIELLELSNKNLNLKEQTILEFIINHPNERYFSIIHIFDVKESEIFNAAIKCTSSESECKKLKKLKSKRC